MSHFFLNIFDTSDFPARWDCGVWTAEHGWLHVVSDTAIFAAYAAIPAVLVYFILRRRDVPFLPVFWLFAAFILSCGAGHLIEATIFWHPWYRLSGLVKLTTAVVSWATVFALVPIIPRALALPGQAKINEQLKSEIGRRKKLEEELRQLQGQLEMRVEHRTAELTHANSDLEHERYLLNALMDNVPDNIYFKDRDSRFIRINKSLANWFELHDPDDAVGKTDADFFTEEHAGEALADERMLMETGEPLLVKEEKETWPDGHTTWVTTSKLPLRDRKGDIIGTFGISRDITQRKRHEEQLERFAAGLERSNKELEQFAYIASHDLQEPLRKVQAFGDILKSKYRDQLGDEGRDYLDRMQGAAARMKTLINDLLTLSRVMRKRDPYEELDLADVAGEAIADLEGRIADTQGRVEVGPLPRIEGDPTQMRQLFQNLIGNGLKYHRPDVPPVVRVSGHLQDAADGSRLAGLRAGQVCQIVVEDNGIGFEQKHAERIFAPFERLHGRTEFQGTGIGLAVCHKIVQRHGGAIVAESVPGQGTKFIVTLPVRHGEPAGDAKGRRRK